MIAGLCFDGTSMAQEGRKTSWTLGGLLGGGEEANVFEVIDPFTGKPSARWVFRQPILCRDLADDPLPAPLLEGHVEKIAVAEQAGIVPRGTRTLRIVDGRVGFAVPRVNGPSWSQAGPSAFDVAAVDRLLGDLGRRGIRAWDLKADNLVTGLHDMRVFRDPEMFVPGDTLAAIRWNVETLDELATIAGRPYWRTDVMEHLARGYGHGAPEPCVVVRAAPVAGVSKTISAGRVFGGVNVGLQVVAVGAEEFNSYEVSKRHTGSTSAAIGDSAAVLPLNAIAPGAGTQMVSWYYLTQAKAVHPLKEWPSYYYIDLPGNPLHHKVFNIKGDPIYGVPGAGAGEMLKFMFLGMQVHYYPDASLVKNRFRNR